MRRFGTALGALLVAGMVTVGSPASAKMVTITYTGTLFGTHDGLGIFGGVKQDGEPFKLVYTLDTRVGQSGSGCYVGYFCYSFIREKAANFPPLLFGVLKVPGVAYILFTGSAGSEDEARNYSTCDGISICSSEFQTVDENNDAHVFSFVESIAESKPIPLDLTTPYNIVPDYSFGAGGGYRFGDQYSGTYGYFDVTRVTLATVPEPAAWAMMLLGLACLGAVARSRRPIAA